MLLEYCENLYVHRCENCCTLEMRAVLPGTRVPAVSMTARRPLTGSRWHGCCRINEVTATTTWTRLHLQGRASPLLTGCFYGNYLLQTRLVGISCKFLPSYKRNRTSSSAVNSEILANDRKEVCVFYSLEVDIDFIFCWR